MNSSQVKDFVHKATFVNIIFFSVVYLLREWGQNYLFVYQENKKKTKQIGRKSRSTRVLTLYQDALVFSTFNDIKMICVSTPYQDELVVSTFEDIKWLDLMIVQTNLDCVQNYLKW